MAASLRQRKATTPRKQNYVRANHPSRSPPNPNRYARPLGILGVGALLLLAVSLLLLSRSEQGSMLLLRRDDYAVEGEAQLLHIVVTRFMQNQGSLKELAKARLELFKTLCLPSMQLQSTQSFLWLILIDPSLDKEIRHELKALIRNHDNYFLIASLQQFQGSEDAFRSNAGTQLLKSRIFNGNVKLLRQAYQYRNDIPLLQTRLDADDGLNYEYLARIQKEALQKLLASRYKWFVWCIRHHVEWYADTNQLVPVTHERLCVTPGLTLGWGVGGDSDSDGIPHVGHDMLFKNITNDSTITCGSPKSNCIRLIHEISLGAIRSRTWTSAGMMDIMSSDHAGAADMPDVLLKEFFGIQNGLLPLQSYLKEHLIGIVKDNLDGQCTKGHSCKIKSMEILQRLIEVEKEGLGGFDVVHDTR